MNHIFKIEIRKSNSKKFEKVLSIMKTFPYYEIAVINQEKVYTCYIKNTTEYINNYSKIDGLVSIVRNWKKAKVYLNGKRLGKRLIFFRIFQTEMDNKAKDLINYDFKTDFPEDVANDIVSLDENLTYPIVYYPPLYSAFFAFAKDFNEKPVFCSCQKESIYKYLDMEKEKTKFYSSRVKGPFSTKYFPEIIRKHYIKNKGNPYSVFKFENNLCFKCLGKTQKYNYCHSMYGGKFKQKYGWHITEKYYEYGLMKYNLNNLEYITDKCPKYILNIINHESDVEKKIERELENIVREEFNFSLIGEQWVNETLMFNILDSIFIDYVIKRHYRPSWLEGLELDAYIPEMKLAFEYNGKQHYEPVEFFGGEEKLLVQQKNDKKKRKICTDKGINLITIKYDQNLSTSLIQNEISYIED